MLGLTAALITGTLFPVRLLALCPPGGDPVVSPPGGSAAVGLCHSGGHLEHRLHLRRDVQAQVSWQNGMSLYVNADVITGATFLAHT